MNLEYLVSKNYDGKELKDFLISQGISHRLLVTLKTNNSIFCNGLSVSLNHIISGKDRITIDLNYEEESDNIVPTQIRLNILYEDDSLLILNKTAGIPVHPSINYYTNSLSNGVKFYFNQICLKKKIRPVNRLDKDTTGVVVFAKNEYIQECLIKQMKNKTFTKEYIAILDGILPEKKRINRSSN